MELLIILSAGKGMTDCWKELKRLGVKIYDRTEATALLTTVENGKKCGIGAIGMNVHTGKLLVFRAKATMLTMFRPARVWLFNPDQVVEGKVPLDYFGALRLNMSYLWNNRYISMQNICTAIGNAFSPKSKSGLCPGAAV